MYIMSIVISFHQLFVVAPCLIIMITCSVSAANDSVVDQQEFYLQLDRWKRISGESHPFLLEMLGCKTHTEPVCLLLEYAENGDLLSFLLNKRKEVRYVSLICS